MPKSPDDYAYHHSTECSHTDDRPISFSDDRIGDAQQQTKA